MKSTPLTKLLVLSVFMFLLHGVALSQPTDPDTGPSDVPITGIEILIGTGAILGVRKLARLRKKK